jgi:hypothetical protein
MDLDKILLKVREKFSPRKMIDFKEEGLHFELEPLTAIEEAKILTALKDVEDTQYIASLKRHSLACSIKKINDIELDVENVEYDEDGEKKKKSKYLYMLDFIGKWPAPLVDTLFDFFSSMNREAELKVKQSAKFEKFILSDQITEEKVKKFRPLDETIPAEQLTPEERLEKKVEKEIEEADAKIAEANVER